MSTESSPLLFSAGAADAVAPKPLPWWRRPRMKTLVPPLFLHILSVTMAIVPLQFFIILIVCQDTGISAFFADGNSAALPDLNKCKTPEVQAIVARWTTLLQIALAIPAFFSVPALGAFSDLFGRKYVMAVPLVGALVGTSTLIFIALTNASLWLLVVARIFTGLCGSWSVLVMISHAYIADIAPEEKRTTKFTLMEAIIFFGFMIGPLLGGAIAKIEVVYVFYTMLVLDSIVLLYILLFLPESLKKTSRLEPVESADSESLLNQVEPSASSSSAPRGSTADSFRSTSARLKKPTLSSFADYREAFYQTVLIFAGEGSNRSRTLVALMYFCMAMATGGSSFGLVLYTNLRFGWDSLQVGTFLFVASFARIFYMSLVLPVVMKKFATGKTLLTRIRVEITIIQIALLLLAVGYTLIGLATESWMLYAVAMFDAFGIVAGPTARSLLSRSTSSDNQARLFSALELIDQLAKIISPIFYGYVYSTSVRTMPNLIFFIIGGFFTLGMVSLLLCRTRHFAPVVDLSRPADEVGQAAGESVLPVASDSAAWAYDTDRESILSEVEENIVDSLVEEAFQSNVSLA
ncbi:major facilitator superfamily domain-containing protein [Polychytrium aggregatum]|uniref:major facilitator superfamily domain-containing protein n=1 Tax=Polychytrium aggregatum TaxID=110093 RepID=UPI0022FDE2AF|nr:major facilitator superfamily domain-containing protein [Polychytrium aggregatum]KAI9206324.1 major facilitator superfamily domain-containing protein [Polychytrium aggregatum]